VSSLRVWKGLKNEVKAGFTADLIIAVPKSYVAKVQNEFVAEPTLIAPIEVGQKLGSLKVSVDGKPYAEYPVVALEEVPLAGFFGRLIDTIRLWFN
jgi:serine-type D-Ala-D-Ala carboxypeptidase (penicillin-binding protein 5/6)